MSNASEQARLRRERRMKLIREGGNDRLNRIRSSVGAVPLEKTALPTSVSSRELPTTVSPGDSEFTPSGSQTPSLNPNMPVRASEFSIPTPSDSPDLAKLLSAISQPNSSTTPVGKQSLEKPSPAAAVEGEQVDPKVAEHQKLWKYTHMVGIISVVAYCFFSKLFLLPWIITLEILLLSTQLAVDRNKLPPASLLTTLGAHLPAPYNTLVSKYSSIMGLVTQVVTDACFTIVLLGFLSRL
ncbi:Sad1 interacting factor 1 [Schizosaccharomyces japonicus yFS275]|uniref:Sad1 interacting factor 1 n=1 Tax=Schizosaccharomyces japonicus (strain yFS275 / FY16936) TaxID=402676 RepID=B6JZB1_SCHJY|nr:Sad1 interacting factor 1 [Schizosaccharomyces japonicus yFS275]EEB06879.1 Sad1 interacting factor 1 [Schizosaccharomyces japonicus yFS275]